MPSSSLKDNIHVRIFDTRGELGKAAATAVAETIRKLLATRPVINMVFAAAPSQNEFLAALIGQPLDWDRINAFHMDEYLGLGPDATQSFGYYLRTHLFDKVPFREVHLMNGLAAHPQAECHRYAALLEAHPTDILCLGIGENNHLAFNDPPVADFKDAQKVKIVALDPCNDACKQVRIGSELDPK